MMLCYVIIYLCYHMVCYGVLCYVIICNVMFLYVVLCASLVDTKSLATLLVAEFSHVVQKRRLCGAPYLVSTGHHELHL